MTTTAPVIVLVGSAGGLDAVVAVLEPLPPTLPASVLVLLHQDPRTGDVLAPLLELRCHRPVREIRSGEPLTTDTVLVVPAGQHALATALGTIVLVASDGPPPYRPSADLLLSTLAVTAGPGVIAVVLSGRGNDGATGAVAVHDLGGTVLAADRVSSAHFAMPEAAIGRDDAVDRVLPVDAIPAVLVDLVDRAADRAGPTA
ncbi:chemotaxis protein CheB [Actinomycetospora cinnamomea]|uniref:protein-glutamate methylesterase n=1 Tax=Actinomycetospora cinnamomea TaxID=663609 RepID=A0A2U1F2G0_9PSEU|nr:chemotaxis protein CheB [Actinomycetospora cinnamomea]PVZ06361.1 two-component system chemotaxis response regulator CheB [Actinomycetospora cinnamomea]